MELAEHAPAGMAIEELALVVELLVNDVVDEDEEELLEDVVDVEDDEGLVDEADALDGVEFAESVLLSELHPDTDRSTAPATTTIGFFIVFPKPEVHGRHRALVRSLRLTKAEPRCLPDERSTTGANEVFFVSRASTRASPVPGAQAIWGPRDL